MFCRKMNIIIVTEYDTLINDAEHIELLNFRPTKKGENFPVSFSYGKAKKSILKFGMLFCFIILGITFLKIIF